jgi:hypothetical protein
MEITQDLPVTVSSYSPPLLLWVNYEPLPAGRLWPLLICNENMVYARMGADGRQYPIIVIKYACIDEISQD